MLQQSKVLFDLGLWAEKTFGSLLLHYYTEVSTQTPLTQERVVDMPIGGAKPLSAGLRTFSFLIELALRHRRHGDLGRLDVGTTCQVGS